MTEPSELRARIRAHATELRFLAWLNIALMAACALMLLLLTPLPHGFDTADIISLVVIGAIALADLAFFLLVHRLTDRS